MMLYYLFYAWVLVQHRYLHAVMQNWWEHVLLLHSSSVAFNQSMYILSKLFQHKLCSTGVLAQLAVIYHKLNKPNKVTKYVNKLESMCDKVCKDAALPDEVLYGRAGYLYSLLYVQHAISQETIKMETINQVWDITTLWNKTWFLSIMRRLFVTLGRY